MEAITIAVAEQHRAVALARLVAATLGVRAPSTSGSAEVAACSRRATSAILLSVMARGDPCRQEPGLAPRPGTLLHGRRGRPSQLTPSRRPRSQDRSAEGVVTQALAPAIVASNAP